MTYPRLIGLAGPAGSGKDTVAAMLSPHVCLAFADPIRAGLEAMLEGSVHSGDLLRYMRDAALKNTPIPGVGLSYRYMAQTLGTEWGRELNGPDFWVNLMRLRLQALSAQARVVISDVRFPNEAALVKALGGEVWHVVRHDVTPVREHVSEQHFKRLPCDRVIMNTGTLDDLRAHIQAVGWDKS